MEKYQLLVCLLLLIFSCQPPTKTPNPLKGITSQSKIEAAFFENNRIHLKVATFDGDSLSFYTDTGGGNLVYPEAVEQLGLTIDSSHQAEFVSLENHFSKLNLPIPIRPQFLYRQDSPLKGNTAGLLGTNWFANKIWHFNYTDKELHTIDSINWGDFDAVHSINVGFMQDSLGNNLTHFPRIPIVIEEDTIRVLFDTGAQATLNTEAQVEFGGAKKVAASFIIATIFDRWRVEHPDWKIIEKGDDFIKEDMIQVPVVSIGGYEVGPVWFARRKDTNFTEFMSQWMDQTVNGAIGGSGFQYFKSIIIDYQEGLAYFEK